MSLERITNRDSISYVDISGSIENSYIPVGVHTFWFCIYMILYWAFLDLLQLSSSLYGISPPVSVNEIDVLCVLSPEQS